MYIMERTKAIDHLYDDKKQTKWDGNTMSVLDPVHTGKSNWLFFANGL